MLMSAFTALAVAASPPAIVGSFGGYDERNDPGTRWERFDLVLTNTGTDTQTVSLCPADADMVLQNHRASTRNAFAIKFDDEAWSFSCDEQELAAGESTTVGMFFRPGDETGPSRKIEVATSVGNFILG
ncbi:hypothetical protein [Erythrobacter sp. MTPC3]|uniref:hypothetical protein n=1 Tax=Erythrobacter sp. MTPC3 TaxID=3056564 RepID=UPI0036F40F6F